jgi:hypothetical protein
MGDPRSRLPVNDTRAKIRGQTAMPVLLTLLFALGLGAQQAVLDHISADSLRGNLSFIASGLLEGRATPSRGLDLAAEYIAAQFRRAGLEPAGDDGYYQTAGLLEVEPAAGGFEMKIEQGGTKISIPHDSVTPRFSTAREISGAGLYKIDIADSAALASLKPEDLRDRVAVTLLPDFSGAGATEAIGKFRALVAALGRTRPKLTLMLAPHGMTELDTRIVNPEEERSEEATLVVRSPEAVKWFEAASPGATDATLTLRLPAFTEKAIKVRNVIGLLRGCDPVLKNTYVLVTAHYDHLGMKPDGSGDRVFHGADDDGSGTVSVIELASALATLRPHPKRSIVFMTFFGEEEGAVGSRYYALHPVFPIEQTVADVNLEQIGRTDSTDGPKLSQATFTGYDYSDVPRFFREAGARTGVRVLSDQPYGDSFFERSDNTSLADQGVPSHTVAVAFEFPDYHMTSDVWQKIDYDNMAKVDRMLALGLILLADDPQAPRWNEAEPKTRPFVKAWKEHHQAR